MSHSTVAQHAMIAVTDIHCMFCRYGIAVWQHATYSIAASPSFEVKATSLLNQSFSKSIGCKEPITILGLKQAKRFTACSASPEVWPQHSLPLWCRAQLLSGITDCHRMTPCTSFLASPLHFNEVIHLCCHPLVVTQATTT